MREKNWVARQSLKRDSSKRFSSGYGYYGWQIGDASEKLVFVLRIESTNCTVLILCTLNGSTVCQGFNSEPKPFYDPDQQHSNETYFSRARLLPTCLLQENINALNFVGPLR